jgi:hypothetical protein
MMPGKIFGEVMEFFPKGLNPFKIQANLIFDLFPGFLIQNPFRFWSWSKKENCSPSSLLPSQKVASCLNQGSYGFSDFKVGDFFCALSKSLEHQTGGLQLRVASTLSNLPSALPSAWMPWCYPLTVLSFTPSLAAVRCLLLKSSPLLLARLSSPPTPASKLTESPLLSLELAIEPRLPCVPGHHVTSCCLLCCSLLDFEVEVKRKIVHLRPFYHLKKLHHVWIR